MRKAGPRHGKDFLGMSNVVLDVAKAAAAELSNEGKLAADLEKTLTDSTRSRR